MKEYNGHRSWNAWNVSLWINNDETLYHWAMSEKASARRFYERMCAHPSDERICALAAKYMMKDLQGQRTPDGARYNHLTVKLALSED